MNVEIDINVKCPACNSIMVRYHDLAYVACEVTGCANHGVKYELPKFTLERKSAQQSVHLTAFGASARAHIAHWLISLAYRILPNGGR